MKKEFFYKIIFVFLFVVCAINIKSYATSSDFTYELDVNNYATITAYKGSNSDITIPNKIDGYEVKKIKNHAFNESRNSTNGTILTNVIISEGITEIGDFAFVGCTNLKSVTLPKTLTSLGDQTFIGCSKLNKVNIPSNLKNFKTYVFQETGITEMVIPENFESIGSGTFRICTQLKSLKVYSKNVTYSDAVFEYCSSDLVLYGYEGSTTQNYAKQNGIKFELLSNKSENTPVESSNVSVAEKNISYENVVDDNATNDNKLPQTGVNDYALLILFAVFFVIVILYKKYNNLKEI